MSIESARAYVKRLATDARFARSIKDAKDAESRRRILTGAGLSFTKAELDSAVSALPADQLSAISSIFGNVTSMKIDSNA